MTWAWEHEFNEQFVIGGQSPLPPAVVVQVEKKVEKIVRAAESLHLPRATYQGASEGTKTATVTDGFFLSS